jgi:hypothetical protein
MGRTDYTEPQCLQKGALFLLLYLFTWFVIRKIAGFIFIIVESKSAVFLKRPSDALVIIYWCCGRVIVVNDYCSAHTSTDSIIKGQIVCLPTAVKRQSRLRTGNLMPINTRWKSQSWHNLDSMHFMRRESNNDKSNLRLKKKDTS